MTSTTKQQKRHVRHKRVRAKISGTKDVPRLCVYKSNTRLIAQLINDEDGSTIAHASSGAQKQKTSVERIEAAATELARVAQKAGITQVVFDRGGFAYTGTIRAFADAARRSGLTF